MRKVSEGVRSVWGMDTTRQLVPAGEALAEMAALLSRVDSDRALASDADRLAWVVTARRVAGRVQALLVTLTAEADTAGACERATGVPLTSWLPATERATRREAHRLVGQGRDLGRYPTLAEATLAGTVGFEQATAISGVLTRLGDDLTGGQTADAEAVMVGYAREFDARGLACLTRRLVEVIDPEGADQREGQRLERDARSARAARHLDFYSDGHGSTLIRGSLPTLDAEGFVKLIDAYAQQDHRRALDRRDPDADTTPAMRRADALVNLVAHHQRASLAPSLGGDRPRIVVTLSYDRLRDECIAAGVLESGESISAGDLRRLACDAEILPAVLGGPSEILDLGRSQRLVSPALRQALTLRDRGCTFPGCDAPLGVCHAHHTIPWFDGGPTDLAHTALVCPHHHNLVEPSRTGPPGHRWELRIADDDLPEVLPPVRVDPARTPRRHQRFRTPPAAAGGPSTEPQPSLVRTPDDHDASGRNE